MIVARQFEISKTIGPIFASREAETSARDLRWRERDAFSAESASDLSEDEKSVNESKLDFIGAHRENSRRRF